MQINLTGHHVEITPALHEFVHTKLQKVEKRFAQITHVHVILSVDKKFQHKAEATINLPGEEIFANAESENMYTAIDLLMDKLDRQVTKHKEKLEQRKEGDGL